MARWVLAKRIVATVSLFLFIVISFQSCAVGLGNILSSSGEASGTAGAFLAFFFLVSGIIILFAAKAQSKVPAFIAGGLLWFGYFIAKMLCGSYSDLKLWGFIAFAIGTFYMFSAVRSKKGYIILSAVSLVYLIIALI